MTEHFLDKISARHTGMYVYIVATVTFEVTFYHFNLDKKINGHHFVFYIIFKGLCRITTSLLVEGFESLRYPGGLYCLKQQSLVGTPIAN